MYQYVLTNLLSEFTTIFTSSILQTFMQAHVSRIKLFLGESLFLNTFHITSEISPVIYHQSGFTFFLIFFRITSEISSVIYHQSGFTFFLIFFRITSEISSVIYHQSGFTFFLIFFRIAIHALSFHFLKCRCTLTARKQEEMLLYRRIVQ